MQIMERKKLNFRHSLFLLFGLKKSAAEAHQTILETYAARLNCRDCFQLFKGVDFDVNDNEEWPEKFGDNKLQDLLDENSAQTPKQLSYSLAIDESTSSKSKHVTINFFSDISEDVITELKVLKSLTDQLNVLNVGYELPLELIFYDNSNIYFYVYTKSSTGGTKLSYDESKRLSSVNGFNTSLRTVFIIHGWRANYQSNDNIDIRAALLAYENVNIISVDWSDYSNLLYTESTLSISDVGKTVGLFIQGLISNYNYSPDNIILIGHSLGAHVSGFAGKELNGRLGVIVGLDPAGPLFFQSSPSGRLNVGDAQYVQAIHTNAYFLGVNFTLANTDFWPNGGYVQPGCQLLSSGCSHMRSYLLMAESIENNQFYARQCDSYGDYSDGKCATNTVALMGGLNFNTSLSGNFYLNTAASSPYGLGNI